MIPSCLRPRVTVTSLPALSSCPRNAATTFLHTMNTRRKSVVSVSHTALTTPCVCLPVHHSPLLNVGIACTEAASADNSVRRQPEARRVDMVLRWSHVAGWPQGVHCVSQADDTGGGALAWAPHHPLHGALLDRLRALAAVAPAPLSLPLPLPLPPVAAAAPPAVEAAWLPLLPPVLRLCDRKRSMSCMSSTG